MNKEMKIETNDCVEEIAESCELSKKLGKLDFKKAAVIGACATAAVGVITVTTVLVRKNKDKLAGLIAKRRSKKRGYTDDLEIDNVNENESLFGD